MLGEISNDYMVSEKARAQNLHTLARHYCIDNIEKWRQIYTTLPERQLAEDSGEQQHRTFPRYEVLGAILDAVETLDATEYGEVAAMRDSLISAVYSDDIMAAMPSDLEKEVMSIERRKFVDYIEALSPVQLENAPPLYHQRVLKLSEVQRLFQLLEERWQMVGWYPLDEKKPEGIDVEAFHTTIFEREVGYERLREILLCRGASRIFELHEGGQSGLERDAIDSESEPTYSYKGLEVWWTDGEANFVIYASHESSITFAGWILDEVRKAWPQWESNVYTGWDQA